MDSALGLLSKLALCWKTGPRSGAGLTLRCPTTGLPWAPVKMAPGSTCGTPKTTESALELQIKLAERKKLVRQCLVGIRTSVHDEQENLVSSLLWAQNGPPGPSRPTLAQFDPQDDEFSPWPLK